MNVNDLQTLIQDQDSFRRAFRKTDGDRTFSTDPKNEIIALLKGQFRQGRTPYIQQVTLPDGSQIRLKFYNTIKQIRNSKGQEVMGKESFLSYLEISVAPIGLKGYFYTTDVQQVVWGTSKSKAEVKHDVAITNLIAQGTELGIDLSAPTAWCSIYTENY